MCKRGEIDQVNGLSRFFMVSLEIQKKGDRMSLSQLIERSSITIHQSLQKSRVKVYKKCVHSVRKQNGLLYKLVKSRYELPHIQRWHKISKIDNNFELICNFLNYWELSDTDQHRVEYFVPHILYGHVLLKKLDYLTQTSIQDHWLDEYMEFDNAYQFAIQGLEKPLLDIINSLYLCLDSEGRYSTQVVNCSNWNLSPKSLEIMKHEALYQFAELFGAIPPQKGTFK